MSTYSSLCVASYKSKNAAQYVETVREAVVDSCTHDHHSLWGVAEEVAHHEYSDEKDDVRLMDMTAQDNCNDFFREMRHKKGIAFDTNDDDQFLFRVYYQYLDRAVALMRPLMAFKRKMDGDHPDGVPYMLEDLYDILYAGFKTKMESLCLLFAEDLMLKVVVLDKEDVEADDCLFDPGVLPEREEGSQNTTEEAEEAEESESEDDVSSVAPSENDRTVEDYDTAMREIFGDKKEERYPHYKDLCDEAAALMEDLGDDKDAVMEIQSIQ